MNGNTSQSTGLVLADPAAQVLGHATIMTAECPTATFSVLSLGGSTSYIAALSASLAPPIPVGGGAFLLNLQDPIFALTFPSNQLAPFVTGLSGTAPAAITTDLSLIPLPDFDADLYPQAARVDLSAISQLKIIRMRF